VLEFERRNIDPAIIARMLDGLRKAGLDVAPYGMQPAGKAEFRAAKYPVAPVIREDVTVSWRKLTGCYF
jgi:hypothetical protein